jgi:hypothetical protein
MVMVMMIDFSVNVVYIVVKHDKQQTARRLFHVTF